MDAPLSAKAALLLELSRGPGSGRELGQRIRARCKMQVLDGTLYPSLHLLEKGALIQRRAGEQSPRGGRPSIHFELTEAGAAAASAIRTTLHQILA